MVAKEVLASWRGPSLVPNPTYLKDHGLVSKTLILKRDDECDILLDGLSN